MVGDNLDVGAVADAVGLLAVVDAGARGSRRSRCPRRAGGRALLEHHAPAFTLPDLDGVEHTLEEWRGTKKLLVAFASW